MPQSCTVCFHPARDAIDKALALHSQSYRSLAMQYGLSETAVTRHGHAHVGVAVYSSKEMRTTASVSYLVKEMVSLHERTKGLLDRAEAGGNLTATLQAVSQVRQNLDMFYKLLALGEVQQRLEAVEAEEAAEGSESDG